MLVSATLLTGCRGNSRNSLPHCSWQILWCVSTPTCHIWNSTNSDLMWGRGGANKRNQSRSGSNNTGIYTQVWGCTVEMSDSSVSSIFRSIKSTVEFGVLPWRWADVSPSGCTDTAANHHPGPSHLESLSCSNLKDGRHPAATTTNQKCNNRMWILDFHSNFSGTIMLSLNLFSSQEGRWPCDHRWGAQTCSNSTFQLTLKQIFLLF